MKGFPFELVLVLLFGAAMLFNALMQKAAKRQQAEAAQNEPQPEEIPEEVWRAQSAADLPPPASAVTARRRAETPPVSPGRPRRRFSRQTLLGSQRKIQDAFVLAAILGPCRGDEPHEIG